MKRYEFIKRCLFGLMVAALMLLGSMPVMAAQNWCVTEEGTLIWDTGGAFYADATCQLVEQTPTNKKTVTRPLSAFISVQKSPFPRRRESRICKPIEKTGFPFPRE